MRPWMMCPTTILNINVSHVDDADIELVLTFKYLTCWAVSDKNQCLTQLQYRSKKHIHASYILI